MRQTAATMEITIDETKVPTRDSIATTIT